jgi:LmbE family N-acetylglucosaminyl deacetylase
LKDNIYFIGAHPDDLIGAAALMLRLSRQPDNFTVTVIDFTRGEGGLEGRFSPEETARIRTEEEYKACSLIGTEPISLGEYDGDSYASRQVCESLAAIFTQKQPRAVITHWPVDTHIDHVMCYAAVRKGLQLAGSIPEMYFFEESIQTRSMLVRYYFQFGQELMDRKTELVRCYASQNDRDEMAQRKIIEARYHGWQCDKSYAEPYGCALPYMAGAPSVFNEIAE